MNKNFDAVIIGSARPDRFLPHDLRKAGQTVALVERKFLGGTCVNTPTKAMVSRANPFFCCSSTIACAPALLQGQDPLHEESGHAASRFPSKRASGCHAGPRFSAEPTPIRGKVTPMKDLSAVIKTPKASFLRA